VLNIDLNELFSVRNRSVVITGGASGIGLAVASTLTDRGANITLLDRDHQKLELAVQHLSGREGKIRGAICNVKDSDNLRREFDSAASTQGGIDIVFANAGIGSELPGSRGFDGSRMPQGEIDSYDVADWENILGVNLTGVFLTAREAARHMKKNGWGRLIITSSEMALRNSAFIGTSYMVSKAGVAHLARNLALELAQNGITVNAIAPGAFETDISGGALHDPSIREMIAAGVPLGRVGQVEDLTGLILFLASPASDYMTGAHISIDGGSTLR
jgi:NAD(P)-dependent dehydrogenase (short-subunit alcohol dehydrogenase family)